MAAPLAVVIPCLEEADRLPLLLADLAAATPGLIAECLVVDGGSSDGSGTLAQLAGARLLRSARGRGRQLQRGIAASTAPWLLLLHADARLQPGWAEAVQRTITAAAADSPGAWCFDLAVRGAALNLRVLEIAVAWRTRLRQLPYGDQGLLMSRKLYHSLVGFLDIPLMEDVDMVRRIGRDKLVELPATATTSSARYRRDGYWRRPIRNLCLLALYFMGVSPKRLARLYG